MRSLITFRLHSWVDFISNSSSEVFIGNTNKTVDTIKTAIEKIVETVDGGSSSLWTSMLQEPEVSKWTITAAPRDYDYNAYENKPRELIDHEVKAPKYPDGKATKKQEDEYNKKWSVHNEKRREIEDRVYAKERKESENEQTSFFKQVCKTNGIDYADLGEPEFDYYDKTARLSYPNAKDSLKPFVERVDFCVSWGISINKGDVLIFTQSDNSFSYQYFYIVDSLLGGNHYHLG